LVCNTLFYYYLENERKTQYHSVASKTLAWVSYYANEYRNFCCEWSNDAFRLSWRGCYASHKSGGKGFNAGQAYEIQGPHVEPISVVIPLIMAGVICGRIAFLKYTTRQSLTTHKQMENKCYSNQWHLFILQKTCRQRQNDCLNVVF
jgi:hypothetical protein